MEPQRFITAFTGACHMFLSWSSLIQSMPPHPTSWRPILILSYHLRLGLPNGPFPSGFPTQTLYMALLSPVHATCPAHLILLDFISQTILGKEYRSLSSSLCSFLHSPVKVGPLAIPDLKQIFLIITSMYRCPHVGDQAATIRQQTSVDQFSSFSSSCSCTIKGYLASALKYTTVCY